MSQFSVYKNTNSKTSNIYPYICEVQSDLLRDLKTTVVIPICEYSAYKNEKIELLTPVVRINHKKHILMTQQLAGISRKDIGNQITKLTDYRDEIIAALDFMITGF